MSRSILLSTVYGAVKVFSCEFKPLGLKYSTCPSKGGKQEGTKTACQTKACGVREDPEFDACMEGDKAAPVGACTTKSFETTPCQTPEIPKDRGVVPPFYGEPGWENPPCCIEVCDTTVERHDVLYLKTDEPKCHQRTWCEYPPVCRVCIPKCCPKEIKYPPMEYRPRGSINKAATKSQPKIELKGPCPKVTMPRCKAARAMTKCTPPVAPKCCQKRCTQYPSFSECCRKRPPPKAPTECACLTARPQCEIFVELRRLASLGLTP